MKMGNSLQEYRLFFGMYWSAFCVFHWWQKNFEDAHKYLARANCARACCDLPCLDRAEQTKVFIWRKICSVRIMTYHRIRVSG